MDTSKDDFSEWIVGAFPQDPATLLMEKTETSADMYDDLLFGQQTGYVPDVSLVESNSMAIATDSFYEPDPNQVAYNSEPHSFESPSTPTSSYEGSTDEEQVDAPPQRPNKKRKISESQATDIHSYLQSATFPTNAVKHLTIEEFEDFAAKWTKKHGNADLTAIGKIRRLIKNRKSASDSRAKKRQTIDELQLETQRLKEESIQLREDNAKLAAKNEGLVQEIDRLKSALKQAGIMDSFGGAMKQSPQLTMMFLLVVALAFGSLWVNPQTGKPIAGGLDVSDLGYKPQGFLPSKDFVLPAQLTDMSTSYEKVTPAPVPTPTPTYMSVVEYPVRCNTSHFPTPDMEFVLEKGTQPEKEKMLDNGVEAQTVDIVQEFTDSPNPLSHSSSSVSSKTFDYTLPSSPHNVPSPTEWKANTTYLYCPNMHQVNPPHELPVLPNEPMYISMLIPSNDTSQPAYEIISQVVDVNLVNNQAQAQGDDMLYI